MATAAANTDSPKKAITTVQQKRPVASASIEEDMLFGPNFRLSTITDPATSAAAAADDERSEAKVRLDAAEKVILGVHFSISGSLVEGFAGKYLSAVDEIILLAGGGVDNDVRGRAQSLLKTVMSRLGKEFRHVISDQAANLDADHRSFESLSVSMHSWSSDLTTEDFNNSMEDEQHAAEERGWYFLLDDQISNLIRTEVISNLKEIADRMIAAGYQKDLCQAYSSARQDFLNGFLSVLGVDQSSIEHTQKIEWQTLQGIRRFRCILRIFLPMERELCDQIFVASDELKEESFRKTAECFVLLLLNLGNVIATWPQLPEAIFRMLDTYEALSDVLLDLQAMFSGDSVQFLSEEAEQIVARFGTMVKGTLAEFGDAIRSENLSKPRQSDQIHPLVRYVTNYIKTLVWYSSSLNLLLHSDEVDGGENSVHGESMTPFGRRMHLLISYLECRIQEISKFYEGDDALKCMLLMNNILYMVQKLEDSELKSVLGDNWVRTRHRQIQQYATCYLRATWSEPLSYLKDDGLCMGDTRNVSVAVKERFKHFNLAFQKIWSTQIAWIVPDPQLREDLRLLILMTVIPGYRSFERRFRGLVQSSKYRKYTPEDLEKYLSDLFEGISEKSNNLRRKLVHNR